MKHLTLILTTLALLAAPSAASAAQFTGDGAAYAAQLQGRFAVPGPAGSVEVRIGGCPGHPNAGGCWMAERAQVWIGAEHPVVMAHELGHVFEFRNLDAEEMAVLEPLLYRGKRWDDCGDPASLPQGGGQGSYGHCPRERFGDAYAACALAQLPNRQVEEQRADGSTWVEGLNATPLWPRAYGYMPKVAKHRRICALIRKFADPVPLAPM